MPRPNLVRDGPVRRLVGLLRVASLAGLVLASACSDAGDGAVDGVGVETWTLGEPHVSIGVTEGDERYQLQGVASGWRKPDGRIVVADGGPEAVRIYDPDGAYSRGFAPRGQGPGEASRPQAAFPYRGDSIVLFDRANFSVSVFDAEGRFGRRVRLPIEHTPPPGTTPSQSCCQLTGVFGDGTFVVHPPDEIPNEPGPPRHSTLTLLSVPADGSRVDTLGTFRSRRFEYDPDQWNHVVGYRQSYGFGYAVAGDRVIGGNGESGTLTVAGPELPEPDSLRLPLEREPLTPELRRRYDQALRDAWAAEPGYSEDSAPPLPPGPWAEHVPVHTTLHVDEADRLWVRRWTLPFGEERHRLAIFTLEGEPLARIELPAQSTVLWIGRDDLLLAERDELNVERVRLYPIESVPGEEGAG